MVNPNCDLCVNQLNVTLTHSLVISNYVHTKFAYKYVMMWGWRCVGRKFSKINIWGKNSYFKRQVYLTLTDGPLVNVFKILVFVTSSSNMITGVRSNFLRNAR